MSSINRRRFLAGLAAGSLAPSIARATTAFQSSAPPGAAFRHGVASGDPLQRRVILWTRVSSELPLPYVRVRVAVYADAKLRQPVRHLRTVTGPWADYTVKFDVDGLVPGRTYYYRFEALGQRSPIGRTRTLADGRPDNLRFAAASGANDSVGHFAGYRHIAEREDLDFVVHLGDYLYANEGEALEADAASGRPLSPNRKPVALADDRGRHARYKRDPDLQEAHRQHPFIAVWDDQEVAKGAWKAGAENHPPFDGAYAIRRAAATKAYFEWMPIRGEANPHSNTKPIFRSFRFGDLARIDMLDTRLFGRDEQLPRLVEPETGSLLVDPAALPALLDTLHSPDRQLLGRGQEDWLYRRLTASTQRGVQWHLLGQQVMMAQFELPVPGSRVRIPVDPDKWDGYPAARERLLRRAVETGRDNLVVLSGSSHSSWANEIAETPYDAATYDPVTSRGSRAVEFITPAMASAGFEASGAAATERDILRNNPHTKYVDLGQCGYSLIDIDRQRARCEWYHLDDVRQPGTRQRLSCAAETRTGTAHIDVLHDGPIAPREESPAPAPARTPIRSFFM